jgi:hypothetical protein
MVLLILLKINFIMESAILHTNSGSDLKLILQLAKKLGISARILTTEELEDFGMSIAIDQGRTGEFIDTDTFLKELQNDRKD